MAGQNRNSMIRAVVAVFVAVPDMVIPLILSRFGAHNM